MFNLVFTFRVPSQWRLCLVTIPCNLFLIIKWLNINVLGLNFHNLYTVHVLFYITNKICKHSFIGIYFIASVYELFDNPLVVFIVLLTLVVQDRVNRYISTCHLLPLITSILHRISFLYHINNNYHFVSDEFSGLIYMWTLFGKN